MNARSSELDLAQASMPRMNIMNARSSEVSQVWHMNARSSELELAQASYWQ